MAKFAFMDFKLIKKDSASKARLGELTTAHGKIQTPIFMPVGTATVKGVHQHELDKDTQAQIILEHYHLYLRPGLEVLEKRRTTPIYELAKAHSYRQWWLSSIFSVRKT